MRETRLRLIPIAADIPARLMRKGATTPGPPPQPATDKRQFVVMLLCDTGMEISASKD
jgi:hypothetical protein